MSEQKPWDQTLCPILSHAVLKPEPVAAPSALIAVGGELKPAAPAAPKDHEFIGCQGPSCAWFISGEQRCAMALTPMALGAIINLQFGDKLTPN